MGKKMKAPFIFMNTDSEYFYIFPDVFFSKSGGAFIVNRKNKQWPFYLRDYFLKQKTKINIKRKLGETRKYEIIYELKKPMCGFFEREMLNLPQEVLINYSSF